MCKSCEALTINGLLCHEIGCPDAWRDYTVSCKNCGSEFAPEEKGQAFCSTCCASSYFGTDCDCHECETIRRQEREYMDLE